MHFNSCRAGIHVCTLFLFTTLSFASEPEPVPTPKPSSPCTGPAYHQFDFWLGSWTVTTADGKIAGTNTIESILSGCALRESWVSAQGNRGTSLNIYSPTDALWRQTWIDEQGTFLEIKGGLQGKSMVMQGEHIARDGKPIVHRIAWTPLSGNRVQQVWSVSRDGGAKWKEVFDGTYTRKQ